MKKEDHNRHNFHSYVQLHKATAADELRPVMNYIHFKNGYAYATNAHILVKAKIEDISSLDFDEIQLLEGKAISAQNYKEMLKHNWIKVTEKGIVSQGEKEKEITYLFADMDNIGKAPDFERVLNTEQKVMMDKIAFKPQLFKSLYDALGCDRQNGIRFVFHGEGHPITVEENTQLYRDITAILMPMLTD